MQAHGVTAEEANEWYRRRARQMWSVLASDQNLDLLCQYDHQPHQIKALQEAYTLWNNLQ
jgi:hypothetical protein